MEPWEELAAMLTDANSEETGDDSDDADDLPDDSDDDNTDDKATLPPALKSLAEKLTTLETSNTRLQEQMEEDRYRFLAQISQLQGSVNKPESKPDPKPSVDQISDDDLVEAMKEHPELAPQILRRMVETKVDSLSSVLESKIMGKLSSEKAGNKIEAILGHYADDMSPKSPIYSQAIEMKETLTPFLDPSIQGSKVHDRLAFLLAAANNPGTVAERFTARNDALEKRRSDMRDRLGKVLGGSDAGGGGNDGPRITEKDIEIGEGLGVDLRDKNQRAKFLKYKDSGAGLGVLAAGEFLGRSKQ